MKPLSLGLILLALATNSNSRGALMRCISWAARRIVSMRCRCRGPRLFRHAEWIGGPEEG